MEILGVVLPTATTHGRWLMSLGRVLDQFAVAVDSYLLNSQCDRCCVLSRPEQVQRGCRWQTRDGAPHQE